MALETTSLKSRIGIAEDGLTGHIFNVAPTLSRAIEICIGCAENSILTQLHQAEGSISTTFQAGFQGLSKQLENSTNRHATEDALIRSLDYYGRMLVSIHETLQTPSQSEVNSFNYQGNQYINRNIDNHGSYNKPRQPRRAPRLGMHWSCTCSDIFR